MTPPLLPPTSLPEVQACLPSTGVVDLSFEAESPLAPPAELLERLPSYDWLLEGGGKSVRSWLLQSVAGAHAGWGDVSGSGLSWDSSSLPWGSWEASCSHREGMGGRGASALCPQTFYDHIHVLLRLESCCFENHSSCIRYISVGASFPLSHSASHSATFLLSSFHPTNTCAFELGC